VHIRASRSSLARQLIFTLLVSITCGSFVVVHAGLRGRGKYSGVVVFDRWDTCFLLSGVYIMYISDDVKERLRPYAGTSIQIDASDVLQPTNPGDGLIQNYEILGPAPQSPDDPITDGLLVEAKSDFSAPGAPAFAITVRNILDVKIKVTASEIGPTLLGTNRGNPFSPSNGNSEAWITRGDLIRPSKASWTSTDGSTISASYTIDPTCHLPDHIVLGPGESVSCRIMVEIPAGQYQFIVGYGGGVHQSKSIVSNVITFHVDREGVAVFDPILHTAKATR
jgi:hypothetical protein